MFLEFLKSFQTFGEPHPIYITLFEIIDYSHQAFKCKHRKACLVLKNPLFGETNSILRMLLDVQFKTIIECKFQQQISVFVATQVESIFCMPQMHFSMLKASNRSLHNHAHVPPQNGVGECKNHNFLEKACSMFLKA